MNLVFTLCSSEAYWPKAMVALDSIRLHHPEAEIEIRNEEKDFPRKRMEQVLDWLERGYQVIALGADCVLYDSLHSMTELLADSATNIVLTPHVCYFPTNRVMALYETGSANGDCIGFNPTPESIGAVKWILKQPLAVSTGQFYEQTPLSMLPFVMGGVVVNRDESINIAWYNIHERRISFNWVGTPMITMFQFSGYDSAKLSTHWPNPTITPELKRLMLDYEAAVAKHARPS